MRIAKARISRVWRFFIGRILSARVRRIGRFLIGGVAGTGIYYAMFFVLNEYCDVDYKASTLAASALATVVSFLFHKFWTFRSSEASESKQQMVLFVAKSLILVVVNTAGLTILMGVLQLRGIWAQGILALPLFTLNFLSTAWIFKIRAMARA